ncbi:MAG: T9SS type A sorting domain-containing protein [Candidatus Marinimicrobia bacterium]|nr:T9SS type A sorting domain-containing protein [Candidatus Neomarinimicrobiota bacterium]
MKNAIYFFPIFLSLLWSMDDINQVHSDYSQGILSTDEFILDQVIGLLSESKVPAQSSTSIPDKCGTHILLTLAQAYPYLAESTKNRLKELGIRFNGTIPTLQRPNGLNLNYDSGIFRFHYTMSGLDRVDPTGSDGDGIPDYINRMAEIFQTVVDTIIETYGFTPPPGDGWYSNNGGDELYDIYVMSQDNGVYGYVQPENPANNDGNNENSEVTEENAFTSYMVLRNNYEGFYDVSNIYGPISELEAVQVTVAHEFFHVIQFGYDGWEAVWLLEATATWMEDEVFDDVNDNYQYLIPWFQDPKISLNRDRRSHYYGSWIFFRYLSEHMGGYRTIRKIFERGVEHDSYSDDFSIQTIDETLLDIGTSFEQALVKMAVANVLLTSNSLSTPYTYEEAEDYRTFGIRPRFEPPIILSDSSYTFLYDKGGLKENASQYLKLVSSMGPLKISFLPEDPAAQHYPQIVIQNTSGLVDVSSIGASSTIQIPQNSESINSINIVIVTGRNNHSYNYQLTLDPEIPLPKELTLIKNYPNPFLDITTIQFFTPALQPMTLTVYDILGRNVGKIYLNDIVEGINEVKFEARHLPSGAYILKLQGRDTKSIQKIILRK